MHFCADYFQDSKNVIYFHARRLQMPKIAFQKCDVITFRYLFFCHCAAKNKDIALTFCMRVVCMYFDHMYSGFLDNLKISDFIGYYFWKIQILSFRGLKSENIKILRYPFCRTFNFTPFGIFRLRLTSKLNILAAFKHLPFFTQNDETWRH